MSPLISLNVIYKMSIKNGNSLIIPLSQTRSDSNVGSQWTNHVGNIKINPGDKVFVKQSIIRSLVSNTSDFILLEKDINITFTLGFYIYFTDAYQDDNGAVGTYLTRTKASYDDRVAPDNQFYYLVEQGDDALALINYTITLKKGEYSVQEFCEYFTEQMTDFSQVDNKTTSDLHKPFQIITLDNFESAFKFVLEGLPSNTPDSATDNKVLYTYCGEGKDVKYIGFGATQFTLQYDNGSYKLACFTPLLDDNDKFINAINVNNDGQYTTFGTQTGCIIVDITDDYSTNGFFFDVLNFDKTKLLNPFTAGQPYFNHLTQSTMFCGIAGLEQTMNRLNGASLSSKNVTSTTFKFAREMISNDNSGGDVEGTHYLLTLSLYGLNTSIDDLKLAQIMSNQYENSKQITVYDDSSVIYTHYGPTMEISNIETRILNPVTLDNSDDIGPGSFVYLQLN